MTLFVQETAGDSKVAATIDGHTYTWAIEELDAAEVVEPWAIEELDAAEVVELRREPTVLRQAGGDL